MLKTSTQLKTQAKEQLKGRFGQVMSVTLFVCMLQFVIFFIVEILPIDEDNMTALFWTELIGFLAYVLIIIPLKMGLVSYDLNFVKQDSDNASIFKGFERAFAGICVGLLRMLFTSLWSLVFIIPGIIKSISYSMAYYILVENPNMKASEAIKWSNRLTDGYKGKIFYICCSLIKCYVSATIVLLTIFGFLTEKIPYFDNTDNWVYILIFLCYVWIMPYKDILYTNLYLNLKELNPEYMAVVEGGVDGHEDKESLYETKF